MNSSRGEWIGGTAGLVLASTPAAARNEAPAFDNIFDVFAHRQSVRRYKSDPVPDEHIRMILDAARRAPTCMNEQPWKFLVVRDKTKIAQMKKQTLDRVTGYFKSILEQKTTVTEADLAPLNEATTRTEGYFTAPVYVVVLIDKQCQCGADYAKQDGVLAAGYLTLAARVLGYGTVYLTDGVPDVVSRTVLNIPDRYQRICMTPIGIPDPWPPPKPKKKLEELVAWETI